MVKDPVIYEVEKGRIKEIRGGKEATTVKRWFEKLNDPNMYIAAHVCYGFNPNAKLGSSTTEDERVWGCTEWGFGYQGPMYSGGKPRVAASHIDGISLECSVSADGKPITKDGEVVHPELVELARACGH